MPRKVQYYKNPQKAKEEHAEYVKKNREKIRKYYRDWYSKNGRNRSIDYIEAITDWIKKNPKKRKAHLILRNAVKRGKIIKSTICMKCRGEFKLSAHHNDYTKPLEVEWLCSSCHKLKHLKIGY